MDWSFCLRYNFWGQSLSLPSGRYFLFQQKLRCVWLLTSPFISVALLVSFLDPTYPVVGLTLGQAGSVHSAAVTLPCAGDGRCYSVLNPVRDTSDPELNVFSPSCRPDLLWQRSEWNSIVVMTCLQIIWIGFLSSFSCHLVSSVPCALPDSFPGAAVSHASGYTTCQTNQPPRLGEKSVYFFGLFTTSFAGFSPCRTGLEAIMETYAFWRPPVRTLTFEDFTTMQKQQGKALARPLLRSRAGEGVSAELNLAHLVPSQAWFPWNEEKLVALHITKASPLVWTDQFQGRRLPPHPTLPLPS